MTAMSVSWYSASRRLSSSRFGNIRNTPLLPNYPQPGYTLFLGPAERADVIIDFSQVPAGSKIILFNDAGAPLPGEDPRYDFFTADPDNTASGGAPTTLAGHGPNTRMIMRFDVSSRFVSTQPAPLVAAGVYGNHLLKTGDKLGGYTVYKKNIAEDFEASFGRLNARLGADVPSLDSQGLTTYGMDFAAKPTEVIAPGGVQVWSISHNGMDTHVIHFHLVNVQVINRVDWAGVIKPPDANELGWKDTVRMNPMEDCIVAMKADRPSVPFAVPDSVRPLDVMMPVSAMNPPYDLGWEYVWHCHILGHEENDMMRPLVSATVSGALPLAPTILKATFAGTGSIGLNWTDNSNDESGFKVYRRSKESASWTLVAAMAANPVMAPSPVAYTNSGLARNTTSAATMITYRSTIVSGKRYGMKEKR